MQLRTSDERSKPERFMHSDHAQWSAFAVSQLGSRQGSTPKDLEEAHTSEPKLSAELSELFSRLRQCASDATKSDPASELVGEMERTAATALHAALHECLSASGVDEESSHIWSDEPAPIAFSVSACMPELTGSAAAWGQLVIAPPSLKWISPSPAEECMACEMEWPLVSFAGTHDDADKAAAYQLRLLQGEDDGLLFGFKHPIDLICFERSFRAAAMSASVAAHTTSTTPATTSTTPAATTPAAFAFATATPTVPPTAPTNTKRQKRTEEPRVQRGRELKAALEKVSKLYANDKMRQAKEAFKAIPEGKALGKRAVLGRADELRELLFTFGGLNTTRSVLDKFISLPEVKRLLDEDFLKSRQELADAQTATAMLVAAKEFLTVIHQRVSGGRRTDAERNAFWASVVSMMPCDLVENRQGRAMMRILGISYKTVKTANVMRRELEDSGKAWVLLTTKRHFDNIEKHWEIFDDWIHGDHNEASSPCNNPKEEIRVYRGYGIDPATGRRAYGLHWRRVQEGNVKELLAKWRASTAAQQFCVATATPKRPQGVLLGRKQLVKWRCLCVKLRAATFADCKICSFVEEGIKLWHKVRFGRRREFLKKHPDHESTCHICSNPELAKRYQEMSRSTDDLRRVLLSCGQTEYPSYSVAGDKPFKAFSGLCCRNRCAKKTLTSTEGACGWSNIFGADCAAEANDDLLWWFKWIQRSRSTTEQEGSDGNKKTFTTDEWAPYQGTWREFLREIRMAIEAGANPYFYHKEFRHRFIRHAIKLHESRKDGVTATELADYAAVLDTPREKSGTCSVPERSNELVVAMGYKPYMQTVETPRRGKRPASSKEVRKQHVDVFFAFHSSGYKPDARSYNTAAEDIDSFLKYGRVRHGEWFLECQRLPGGDHSRELPEGFSERPEQPPDFPEYVRKLSIKDGCAMQFDGKDNYHQVAEWKGKTVASEAEKAQAARVAEAAAVAMSAAAEEDKVAAMQVVARAQAGVKAVDDTSGIGRVDWKLETMHGKNVCDPLSNMPKRTLEEAIERGDILKVGTREKVIYLALHRPTPEAAKMWKDGWWTVGRIFWGYFEHRQFTALNVPRAIGFKDSHEMHLFAGLGSDAEEARINGPIAARGNVCACLQCIAGNYDACEMQAVFGTVRRVKVPREKNQTSGLRQLESLHLWAAVCKKGQLAATRVASDEVCLEGLYYLVLLLCAPYTLDKDLLFATDQFEKGDLVVRISYYKYSTTLEGGFRKYSLLGGKVQERMIHVSSLIRIQGLLFSPGPAGPAGRVNRRETVQSYYLSRDTHNTIEASCYESKP